MTRCPFCGEATTSVVCPCCKADLVHQRAAPRPILTFQIGGNPDRANHSARWYVYLHRDSAGQIFYVGQGVGSRAWSVDRHDVWHRYVNERLGGKYEVEIFRSELTPDAATELEQWLIEVHGRHLVNWANSGRQFDYEALERYQRLRNANRAFVEETRSLEASNLNNAIERYYRALEIMREYESLTLERGLVAELSDRYKCGDLNILNRLTLCLVKAGRAAEADGALKAYFAEFPDARDRAAVRPIITRVARALERK